MSITQLLQAAAYDVTHAEYTLASYRRKREAMIIQAHAEGLSLRRIGEIAGVSHQTVANVVAAGAATTTSQHQPPS